MKKTKATKGSDRETERKGEIYNQVVKHKREREKERERDRETERERDRQTETRRQPWICRLLGSTFTPDLPVAVD